MKLKSQKNMIELGFAYSQLHKLDSEGQQKYLYPFCIPPLGPNALQGTPLGNIEAAQIDIVDGFRSILENNQDFQSGRNKRIRTFVDGIRTLLLTRKGYFAEANVDVYCSDNVVVKDNTILFHTVEWNPKLHSNFESIPFPGSLRKEHFFCAPGRNAQQCIEANIRDLLCDSSWRHSRK